MKNFFKYLARTLLAILGLLLLIVVLLYLPPVQNFLREKAVKYVSSHYGLEVEVGYFRLGFPADLVLEDVYVAKPPSDTLMAAGSVRLKIGLGGIFRREVSVDEMKLRKVKFGLSDDTTGMELRVAVGEMELAARRVDLKNKAVEVDRIQLAGGDVSLKTGKETPADTSVSQPVDWSFDIKRIEIREVSYRMNTVTLPYLGAGIVSGVIAGGKVSLRQQTVDIDSLRLGGGWCDMQLAGRQASVPGTVEDTVASEPWVVRAGALKLENSAFQMQSPETGKMNVILSGISIEVDSVYNRGMVVKGRLKDLSAVQKDGPEIRTMRANIDLDTMQTELQGVYIQTAHSVVRLNAFADSSLTYIIDKVPLRVNLEAQIGLADITPFYDGIPAGLRREKVNVRTAFHFSDARIQVDRLKMDMPGHFQLSGQGQLAGYRDLKKMSGNFGLRGVFTDLTFVNRQWLQGSGVDIPKDIDFSATLNARQGMLAVVSRLCNAGGCAAIDANYRLTEEKYNAEVHLTNFPLEHFLTIDSIGRATAVIQVEGRYLAWPQIQGEASVDVARFLFKEHDYRDISLRASLYDTRLRGSLTVRDSLAPVDLVFQGDSVEQKYKLSLIGEIGEIDWQALHWMQEPFRTRMNIDVEATAGPAENYTLRLRLDSLRLTDARQTYALGPLSLDMKSDLEKTILDMNTGDLKLAFRTDTSLMGFAGSIGKVAQVIQKQVDEKNIDMETVRKDLPVFSFRVEGAQDNAIMKFLKSRNIGFKNLEVDIVSRRRSGIRVGILASAPYFGSVRLDSVQIGAWQTGRSLVYSINAGSSAEAWKGLFNVNMTGRMQGDRFRMELRQKDAQGQIGFDLGVNLVMQDSAFTVSFFPMNPILGYSRWMVNADNRIVVRKDWKIRANLRMAYQNKLVSLQSLPDEGDRKDRLQIEIAGVNLANLTRMVPFMPDLRGLLHTDLYLYSKEGALGAEGQIGITEMYYEQQRIGSVDLGLQYTGKNRLTDHDIDFELRIDSIRRAIAEGFFSTSPTPREMRVNMDIPSLPLYILNAFIPADLLQLSGELVGGVRFRGTLQRPLLDGSLAFRQGQADVVVLGTTFALDTTRLNIADGKLRFRQYRFIAPNNSDMTLNGEIVLTPFDRMSMNLSVEADNFEVVNVKKNPTSLIYGKAYVDIGARLAGAFSNLNLTGNVNLLNRTNITYTLRSSDPQLVDRSADLVRFVSFRDSTLNEEDDLTNQVDISSFALKTLIEIGDQVGVTVELSEDGSNNIFIQGGGNLVLVMNPESGLTLSGKYILSGGTVVYNIPLAGKKEFNIRSGSYVEWTGNVVNPMLNISASELVKATVEDGDRNRLVTFEAIILIQNTLTHPDITFDLSAPNDMVIQNQLTTFSPEERTRQALNLLIYNTYTAPGAAKSSTGGNMANNALYSFVENELNKYTRKTGFTFGVDSYNTDENTTRTDYTYQFSRQLFNDRVSVKIGGRISTDNNEMQGGNNVEDNLVDDISIEYVLTKKRNLFLKVFRHSNYESVLDGEVTQTGVGIVWRKNFRKFKDLFRNNRKLNKEKVTNDEAEGRETRRQRNLRTVNLNEK